MTRSADHIGEELLSAFVDDQVTTEDRALVQAHLQTCAACQQRLDELRAVVDLLHALPDVPTPRDFMLGPRVVADPPNVVRLRRWYAATRLAAGSLAAVFVLLTAGALYVDSRPTQLATTAASQPQPALAPTTGQPGERAAATTAPAAARAAAPAAVPQASPAAAFEAPQPGARVAPGAPTTDQRAASTGTSALPTLAPTPAPTAIPLLPRPLAVASTDDAAPLRIAAITIGILAVLSLVTAVAVRHRLQRAVFRL